MPVNPDPQNTPRQRRFDQQVARVLNDLERAGLLTRGPDGWVIEGGVSLASPSGLELVTADDLLRIDLADAILELHSSGLRFASQNDRLVLAGPASGGPTAPTFRSLSAADVAASAASRLFGRGSAGGAGAGEEILIGANLSMSGTTLVGTATGAGVAGYVPPVLGDFTFYNQNFSTAATPVVSTYGGIYLSAPSLGAADDVTVLGVPVTVPYDLTAGYWTNCVATGVTFGLAGLGLHDTGSGKIYQFRYGGRVGATGVEVMLQRFSDFTTAAGTVDGPYTASEGRGEAGGYWVRLVDDGVDREFYVGSNADSMQLVYSEASGTYLTPDVIGLVINPFSAFTGITCFHFDLTT